MEIINKNLCVNKHWEEKVVGKMGAASKNPESCLNDDERCKAVFVELILLTEHQVEQALTGKQVEP